MIVNHCHQIKRNKLKKKLTVIKVKNIYMKHKYVKKQLV